MFLLNFHKLFQKNKYSLDGSKKGIEMLQILVLSMVSKENMITAEILRKTSKISRNIRKPLDKARLRREKKALNSEILLKKRS